MIYMVNQFIDFISITLNNNNMKKNILLFLLFFSLTGFAQVKILFDATKAETASNADWQIDADNFDLDYDPNPVIGGNEANPQRYPTPDQSTVTAQTNEDYWTGANSAWGIELVQYGYMVETLPFDGKITYGDSNNPQDLSNYDVFIVTEPNILFNENEKTAILNYVYNGGGLFITADHDISDRNGDGEDSVDVWNDLFNTNNFAENLFGFEFNYENFSLTSTSVADLPDNPILHGYFGDVVALEFHGGTSLQLSPENNPNVTALVFKQDDLDTREVLCASSQYGQGRVVAIGDSSPADDGTGDTHDSLYNGWYDEGLGSHRKLMLNATIWLAQEDTNALYGETISPLRVFVRNNQLYIILKQNQLKEAFIYDLTGKLVMKLMHTAPSYKLDNLPHGMYIINLTNQNGQHYISKFVK